MAKQTDSFTGNGSEEALLERYIREISSYAPLSDEQEAALSARALAGDRKAKEALVNANLKFVVSIARRYAADGKGMPDLINEGNIALIRAAGKFDAGKGKRFSQYAVRAIRKAMTDFRPDSEVKVKNTDMDVRHFGRLSPEGETDDEADTEALARVISMLPERERTVMSAYYGVGEEPLTMREIGLREGLKRERVRQIRKRALRRLQERRK